MLTKVREKSPTASIASGLQAAISEALDRDGVVVLPPQDVKRTLTLVRLLGYHFDTAMLDPWYNKGFGGVQDDYRPFFLDVIRQSGDLAEHVYFWGFPEIVAPFVERIQKPLELVSWLTWYYKNNPSVLRGWRSSQNACLHMSHKGAVLHPERFLNEKQLALKAKGKLRYMPGPTSVLDGDFDSPTDVIEQALLVGFVGRKEQTGHPSQKPFKVYDQLMQMSMSNGGLILDPMCGSGTVGAVAKERGFRAILCDGSDDYTKLVENRLGVKRLPIEDEIGYLIDGNLA
ncbi:MAG: site-specific DNA-methyltransferase [Betaproteobacteria bacterium]|nr:site-specific DNA-methyltransferase [Betaproteobacteria bacterium]